jgi:protein-serine/threonine kinase
LAYCSPEVVKKDLYDSKTDVWSLGIMFYAVLRGRLPFISNDKKQTIHNISNEQIDFTSHERLNNLSEKCKDIIRKMLEKDDQERVSIKTLS